MSYLEKLVGNLKNLTLWFPKFYRTHFLKLYTRHSLSQAFREIYALSLWGARKATVHIAKGVLSFYWCRAAAGSCGEPCTELPEAWDLQRECLLRECCIRLTAPPGACCSPTSEKWESLPSFPPPIRVVILGVVLVPLLLLPPLRDWGLYTN